MLYLYVYTKAENNIHVQGLAQFPHTSAFGKVLICAMLWCCLASITPAATHIGDNIPASPSYRILYFIANLLFNNK